MKRIDRVYQALMDEWSNQKKKTLLTVQGTSASELAERMGLSRANVSLELNNLVRARQVVKSKSYPVKYVPLETFEKLLEIEWPEERGQVVEWDMLLATPKIETKPPIVKRNPFELVIGSNDSLRKPISQAMAAIHYPPNGLHMLLLGQTGSGKTFFARKIYDYAVYEGILVAESPFQSFNCADYYTNPQLLMSQLFGYCKGAFTGAEEDHEGLIEKADGGILFLDEIHRLTPEGQEMLFYFIDHGQFNRLGENGFARSANVLIVCATTEDPSSTLLKTFLRRIPMNITIPNLNERSFKERVELIKFLFNAEANRVKKAFIIDIDVFEILIETVSEGNVGQLKSQIQLICAHAFLEQLHSEKDLQITFNNLPEDYRLKTSFGDRRSRNKRITKYLGMTTRVKPNEQEEEDAAAVKDINVYEVIQEKVRYLEEEGVSNEEIHSYILTDLHLHIKNFIKTNDVDLQLLKFVDPVISELTMDLREIAEKNSNRRFDSRFLYYIGMHMDAYTKRKNQPKNISHLDIEEFRAEHPEEYELAIVFKKEIVSRLDIHFPEIEVIYLAMLLVSIGTLKEKKQVGVLVVTHGISTATSMVKVATDLLGAAPITSLNMPLEISPEEIYSSMVIEVKKLDNDRGVLLLVDMGSLAMFEERITKETGVKIKIISHVTTSMVLDAVRKVSYMDLDLNGIYHSIKKDFKNAVMADTHSMGKTKAVLSICSSGSGTAKKLEAMLLELIDSETDEAIEVITLSSLHMKEKLPEILEHYQIIASVGTNDPQLNVPYVSLEALIQGEGENIIRHTVGAPSIKISKKRRQNGILKELCQESMEKYLVYLNPYHLSGILIDWAKELEISLGRSFSNALSLKLIVHTAFALERVIKRNPLCSSDEYTGEQDVFEAVEHTLAKVQKQLDLTLSPDEIIIIAEVVSEK